MLVAQRPVGPEWRPVMSADVLFAPIDRAMLRRARKAALETLGKSDDGDEASAADQIEELGDALSEALILLGVRGWRGVALRGDDGETQTLEFSADNLAIVLSDPITFDAFDAAYVVPFAAREREKNGSPASPNGTGEAGMAASGTASSVAAAASGACNVRTGSKRPNRSKPKASGTS